MKIAKEIAESWCYDDMEKEGLEALIVEKLEPVRETLERIKSAVVCEGVPLRQSDEYDKECSPKMALSEIGENAIKALAMLSDDE